MPGFMYTILFNSLENKKIAGSQMEHTKKNTYIVIKHTYCVGICRVCDT